MRVTQRDVISIRIIINALDCANCGIVFGISDEYEQDRREDGQWFYCPNGHYMRYDDNAWQKLDAAKANVHRLQAQIETRDATIRQLSDDVLEKAKEVRSLKRRATAGVCAFCHRTFQNVQRHMTSKHGEKDHA